MVTNYLFIYLFIFGINHSVSGRSHWASDYSGFGPGAKKVLPSRATPMKFELGSKPNLTPWGRSRHQLLQHLVGANYSY